MSLKEAEAPVDPFEKRPAYGCAFLETCCYGLHPHPGVGPGGMVHSRRTGLGLAVVSKVIGEHGGEISVDSVEGEWTEFRIALPPAPAV